MNLPALGAQCGTDKGTDHTYLEVYQHLFESFRHRPIRLLELGVGQGASLRLWRTWFPQAHITGLDRSPPDLPDLDCDIVRFSQTDRAAMEATWSDETFDVIIDDASHHVEVQLLSLCWLWPKLKSGGLYVIEDVGHSALVKYFSIFRPLVLDRSHLKARGDDILVILQK
jgi:hypothetical protein